MNHTIVCRRGVKSITSLNGEDSTRIVNYVAKAIWTIPSVGEFGAKNVIGIALISCMTTIVSCGKLLGGFENLNHPNRRTIISRWFREPQPPKTGGQ